MVNYKRINKPIARKMYNHGCHILLLPCKVNDSLVYDYPNQWIRPTVINISKCTECSNKFDRTINEYEYYNCNAELGYYAHYFVSEEDYKDYQRRKSAC